ncbi:hypothetical protein D9756_011353 [Leucocoprinus leucothites]|uniref:Response regulatory domain-containing protein n=1 Tax=Leucocoprinus leucothites TaxID=201217 RepID=A0A8H5CNA6_9AGAR|nr:hypothetical protein D9756_011353 [Leucoagaricus leucothites]
MSAMGSEDLEHYLHSHADVAVLLTSQFCFYSLGLSLPSGTDHTLPFMQLFGFYLYDTTLQSVHSQPTTSGYAGGGGGRGGYDAAGSMIPPPSMSIPSMNVGKASLMQMSEISRRLGSTSGPGSWNAEENSSQGQSASSSNNGGASGIGGLFSMGSLVGMSKNEAIMRIEEMYRARMNSASSALAGNSNAQTQWASPSSPITSRSQQVGATPNTATSSRGYSLPEASSYPSSSQSQPQQPPTQRPPSASFWSFTQSLADEESSSALGHEGLQVCTIGQFIPRNSADQVSSSSPSGTGATNWNFDPTPLTSGSSTSGAYASAFPTGTSGLRLGDGVVGEKRMGEGRMGGQAGGGGEEEERDEEEEEGEEESEEEERVMPSPVNAVFAGQTTLPSTAASSSSSATVRSNSGTGTRTTRRSLRSKSAPRSTSTSPRSTRRGNAGGGAGGSASGGVASGNNGGKKKLRVRRSTFVPGWAVPPRVLLVDDDIVSRKLGSKFLQVFGCTIDVAVDGMSAVNKMNLEKYDLVLMDIVMPKLDGVAATSMIRQFDHLTPIISMTSNSKPNEIMTYYSSGMNDILPKPFTQAGLFEMLEKHLIHLKAIQKMNQVPRSIGVPPLSDASFEQAVTTGAASLSSSLSSSRLQPGLLPPPPPTGSPSISTSDIANDHDQRWWGGSGGPYTSAYTGSSSSGIGNSSGSGGQGQERDDDERINPLSGMGLTDEQYNMILQNIVNGESFMNGIDGSAGAGGSGAGEKRRYDESGLTDSEDARREKRSRFEVIE